MTMCWTEATCSRCGSRRQNSPKSTRKTLDSSSRSTFSKKTSKRPAPTTSKQCCAKTPISRSTRRSSRSRFATSKRRYSPPRRSLWDTRISCGIMPTRSSVGTRTRARARRLSGWKRLQRNARQRLRSCGKRLIRRQTMKRWRGFRMTLATWKWSCAKRSRSLTPRTSSLRTCGRSSSLQAVETRKDSRPSTTRPRRLKSSGQNCRNLAKSATAKKTKLRSSGKSSKQRKEKKKPSSNLLSDSLRFGSGKSGTR
ncbi:uncharacterized protein BKA78DRAFT_327422 [Phyllosticta capitalensis]|uniref:uncharacterized protein n=1 Tax=Phyllosticta capitalensis TaxID=121624 RepID=UPI00313261D2